MYHSLAQLLELANSDNLMLWEIVLKNEKELTSKNEEQVFSALKDRLDIMRTSAKKALNNELTTVGGLISGTAKKQYNYSKDKNSICGSFLNEVMAFALSGSETNAAMGKICAAPTAGSCGILPAVLFAMEKRYNLNETEILKGLLTASGIGAIISKNATVAGAEGGCQAECGVAAAMSAAAAVYLAGGDNNTAIDACSLALINIMGLVCDPIAGLVQIPCAQRNASQAVNALISADMALGGMKCVIPPDEVVDAMYRVGRMMPTELKETAMGGIAVTQTGQEIMNNIFN